MDIFGLNGYSLDKRAQLVRERGSFITVRHLDRFSISLYHMEDFFAEVWYHKNSEKLVLVRGFKEKAYLDPYLEMIDLHEIEE